jgi:tetratricopeptide (TPR) repeat protein
VIDDETVLAADHAYWRAEAYLAGYGATQGGDLAVDLLEQSREHAATAGDVVRQVRALTGLVIALAKDDATLAQTTWSQALTLAREHAVELSVFPFAELCVRQVSEANQDVRVAAQALLNPDASRVSDAVAIRVAQLLTDMEIAEGQWEAAAFHLEDLVTRTRMVGDRVNEVEALLQWAWVCDQMALPDAVTANLERSLTLALQMGRPELIERCRRWRSEWEQRQAKGELKSS